MPRSMTSSLTKADLEIFMLTPIWLHATLHHYISSRVLINVSVYFVLGRFFHWIFCVVDLDTSFQILKAVVKPDRQLTDFLKLFLPDPKPFGMNGIEPSFTVDWMKILASLVSKFLMTFYCMVAYLSSSTSLGIWHSTKAWETDGKNGLILWIVQYRYAVAPSSW